MTREEREWMRDIVAVGCVVCALHKGVYSPPDVHHMLSGGRRRGHRFTIPICPPHHRGGRDDAECVSRDQNRRRFEARYGTEEYLFAETQRRVAELRARRVG